MAIGTTPEERTRTRIIDRLETGIGPRVVPVSPVKVGIFIAHGMGQQLPFQTLDELAQGLINEAAQRGRKAKRVRAENLQIGDTKTQRIAVDLRDMDGNPVRVHLYEGYWAPITEGQVTLRDVMAFLIRAGCNGIQNCLHPFQRWMFGGFQTFRRQKTGWALLLALLVVLSLIALNMLAVGYGARYLLGATGEPPGGVRLEVLTTLVGTIAVITSVLGGTLWALRRLRPAHPSGSTIWKAVNAAAALLFWLWVVATAVSGPVAAVALVRPAWLAPIACPLAAVYWAPVWGALLIASYYVRKVMVQFPGDVAAYISSHALDRFSDIRIRIKETVLKQLTAVYQAAEQYDTVIILGHSLGSVVAYDALNALMVSDATGTTQLNVVDRTRLLLTFGSPLDKTAFIFAAQGRDTTAVREAAAATLQPMILDYCPYRDVKWINIHSPRDIVSGPLNFYDVPGLKAPPGVINLTDRDALIPLYAHIEYWSNPLLFQTLYSHLTKSTGAQTATPQSATVATTTQSAAIVATIA